MGGGWFSVMGCVVDAGYGLRQRRSRCRSYLILVLGGHRYPIDTVVRIMCWEMGIGLLS